VCSHADDPIRSAAAARQLARALMAAADEYDRADLTDRTVQDSARHPGGWRAEHLPWCADTIN
jgi:hypothetical protein